MSIFTKKGDRGETFLANQKKLLKSHLLIEVIGNIDELQAFIGLVKSKTKDPQIKNLLLKIEYDLYLIMSYLGKTKVNILPLSKKILFFETIIKEKKKNVGALKGFVLPGKNEVSAWFHILRTITRRCERKVVALFNKNKKDKFLILITSYFNRLSDLFFIFSL